MNTKISNYDLIVLSVPKDYNTLRFCLSSCIDHLNPQPENIFVIYPNEDKTDFINNTQINYVNEDKVVDFKKLPCNNGHRMQKRPFWVYQQFIKLFQDITPNKDYLSIDSDLVLKKDLDVFNNGKRRFFTKTKRVESKKWKHKYNNITKEVFGIEIQDWDYSFITEIMLFNKDITREIANSVGGIDEFYRICLEKVDHKVTSLSEFELYGNYILKYHNNLYDIKHINYASKRKRQTIVPDQDKTLTRSWNNYEIETAISYKGDEDYIVFNNDSPANSDGYNKTNDMITYRYQYDEIRASLFPYEKRFLFDKIVKHKPNVILELGTGKFLGSAKIMLEAIIQIGKGKIYTCDPSLDKKENILKQMNNCRHSNLIDFHVKTGQEMIQYLKNNDIVPDFLFFDGPEDPNVVLQDFVDIKDYVGSGCVFVAHDWEYENIRIGNDYSKKHAKLKPHLYEQKDWKIIEELSGLDMEWPNVSDDGSYNIENTFGMIYAIKK